MLMRSATRLMLFACLTAVAAAQGPTTTATKDDWEEINFEFNMSVLTDGYPSLLRLAELLNQNPAYKVAVEGHTDSVGSAPYNDKLALARANTVKGFLEKYGARAGQVIATGRGKSQPKAGNTTQEGRWINRRVVMTVTDAQGRVVGAGGVGDAIKAIERIAQKQEECCSKVLKQLEKLDEILAALRDLKSENASLRRELEAVKAAQSGIQKQVEAPKPPPPPPGATPSQVAEIAEKAAAKAAAETAAKMTRPRFSILNLNAGPDSSGDLTFTGKGRFFAPFSDHHGFQAQAEYLYFRDRKEGQIDFGLINRYKSVQLGLFSSFKTVSFNQFQSSGTLGQGALTFDYLFKYGKVGVFGTKGFLDKPVIHRAFPSRNLLEETYLKVVDQAGASTSLGLHKRVLFEGNLGYLKARGVDDKPGGTMRFLFPVHERFAFTVEGGFNETLVTRDHSGRVVFGVQFGNFLQPREFAGLTHPVPADIPRVRFELLTRRIRTGNDAPVADAGPDQIGVAAGSIRLDGSASFDPDGDPITFQWSQIAGPAISLSGAATSMATFTAAEGQTYSFRLLVRDDRSAQGLARVTVTTREAPRVRILRFTATPATIRSGQSSTLAWQVDNADEVTISGIGRVDARGGATQVTPTTTTTYTLTARNRVSEAVEDAVVTVERPQVRILRYMASPEKIRPGQSSALCWDTLNATTIEIGGVGPVRSMGCVDVSPKETTAYPLVARNEFGEARSVVTVTVLPGARPVIVRFTANPVEIIAGDTSTLNWTTEGADEVTITTLGKVDNSGGATVTPPATTTYTLTAKNRFGEATATATVSVVARVRIISFTASPNPVAPGDLTTISWVTENATAVTISGGIGPRPVNGSIPIRPTMTATYTLTATGPLNQQVTATLTVAVTAPPATPTNRPPVANAGSNFETIYRDNVLDGSQSSDPDGDMLTYNWTCQGNKAAILDQNARPRVQLMGIQELYIFELTVTDSRGASSKSTVAVNFIKTSLYR